MSRSKADGAKEVGTACCAWRSRGEDGCGSSVTRRFFCCICPETMDDSPPYQVKKHLRYFRSPARDEAEEVEEEAQRRLRLETTSMRSVQELGTDNPSFTVTEDTLLEESRSVGRSVSSVSTRHKRKLTPLSSLPLQTCTLRVFKTSLGCDEDSDVSFVNDSRSLLTPPVINLIPPTPSEVIVDDQFFDNNSEEESVARSSGGECVDSAGSHATGDPDSFLARMDNTEASDTPQEGEQQSEGPAVNCVPAGSPKFIFGEDVDKTREGVEEKLSSVPESDKSSKLSLLRSTYQFVLASFISGSFNAGINLLQFTEQNLDDLKSKDPELLKAELRLLPLSAKMDPLLCVRKPAARTCSLGDVVSRSRTFETLPKGGEYGSEEEGSPRQRRITVASYIPQKKDPNLAGKLDSARDKAKLLEELDSEEICQWFTQIGLQKCVPLIKGSNLLGSHIASIDLDTLDLLHVSSLEDRECLLSAIYCELHPQDATTESLDTLLGTIGPHNVEKFTAALVNLGKAGSPQLLDDRNNIPRQFQFRDRGQHDIIQNNSHLIELTIKAVQQKVHLRVPKEMMVGKLIESCLKMLGVTENKDLFLLNVKSGNSQEGCLNGFPLDKQVGDLISPENRHLELHLYKKDNPMMRPGSSEEVNTAFNSTEPAASPNTFSGQEQKPDRWSKEDKIRHLKQQVDSLQNVVNQVQDLHQSLVCFCSELKHKDPEPPLEAMCPRDAEKELLQTERTLKAKEMLVQSLHHRLSSLGMHRHSAAEEHLLDKMRLDCQIFKEEINIILLNRQMVRLKSAHRRCKEEGEEDRKCSALGRWRPTQSPAEQEAANPRGQSFTVQCKEGSGFVAVGAVNSQLHINDR
ncbi:uncharacterized protein LOC136718960 [Amia ocellicauda]|uniref:uncharacterized protein LOC136718960 n=1 Tax=Amia ocellicauda TaxID=2972642 RepID=UPI00346416D8